MSKEKCFTAHVEGPSGGPDGDYRRVSPNDLTIDVKGWSGDRVPDVLILPDGKMIVKVSRYLTPGDHYCFIAPTVVRIDEGGVAREVVQQGRVRIPEAA